MTYSLAVRLGSHATIVAATIDGVPRRLPLEDSRDWMPSSVWVSPDGAWQSGTAALALAAASPEGFEAEPLRAAGEDHLLLSGRLVPASAAIGALLSGALVAAARVIPAPPTEVRLTYPAHWGPARRHALEQAAATALAQGAVPPAPASPPGSRPAAGPGIAGPSAGRSSAGGPNAGSSSAAWPDAAQPGAAGAGVAGTRAAGLDPAAGFGDAGLISGLISEPLAAAAGVGLRPERTTGPVAFLDIGGATTTATVLRAGPDGFAMAGPPAVREHLGGQDIDRLIVAHLGEGAAGQHEDWPDLMTPASERFRQGALDLRTAVRAAKHQLSQRMAAQVAIPVLGLDVQLTRPELERLMPPVLDEMVEVLRQALAAASVAAADLAGLYLIGGSSRIPLVADRVWELIRA
ncbi:MAG TPA: Hsp70 family protein, partial [Streptosporangiaceae bacterium]